MALSGKAGPASGPASGTATRGKTRAMQVTVVVRVRPALAHEKCQPVALRVRKAGRASVLALAPPHAPHEASEFVFDKCYGEATPQRLLYQREIQPAVARVLAGVHTTVFAYGATGTGKTFTMEGSTRNLGLIPRCVKQLFDAGADALEMSYLEIYNDRVLDLLVPKTQQTDLPIRQQPDGAIAVQGLSRRRIASLREFEELYARGSAARARAATELNAASSRSHSILMLQARTADGAIRYGKLHLIDLAGSEDNRRTGNSGARLAESGKINMSLFVLGKVITALNTGDVQRIPFRDSKLTRLLQDSLGGSSHAVMICNVAQTAALYNECLQTLNYASKARGIVNHVAVNTPAPVKKQATKADAKSAKTPAVTKQTSGVKASTTSTLPKATKAALTPTTTKTTTATRLAKPIVTGASKPVLSRTSMSPSADPMENKLSMWKQNKLLGRSSLEKRPSADGMPMATGIKRPSPVSSLAGTSVSSIRSLNTSRMSIANAPMRVLASEAGHSQMTTPVVKKPRLSVMPSSASQSATNSSRASLCPKPVQRRIINPTDDKENVSSNVKPASLPPSPVNVVKDLSPVDLAKKLIGVAIDLEKAKHYAAAYCIFKRAYHVLPEENPKLVERLTALEAECPTAPASVPSQHMSTAVYMQLVLEMNLLHVLNTGSPAELTKLHSIGDKRAEKIIEKRPFSQLSDLLNVAGITDKLVQKLHDHHVQWC